MNMQISRYQNYMYSYPHKTAYRPFAAPVALAPYLSKLAGKDASLYFHIPFCQSKCGYCNLFSQQRCTPQRISAYLETMRRQAGQLSGLTKSLKFTSFAIGGGTPLILDAVQLNELFGIAGLFGVHPDHVPTSVETSPDYADPKVLTTLINRGVERLSIGIQSFHAAELDGLKRHTSLAVVKQALENIKATGFPCFNIDLIYGIENQTVESFLSSVRMALDYQPDELFIYPLYVRPGTGIKEKSAEHTCYEMYKVARELLLSEGFIQTSMRRFIKRNTKELEFSCGDEVMLSCGSGGRSYLGNLHYATPYAVRQKAISKEIDRYIGTMDFTHATNGFILSAEETERRFIIKNLMYYRGLDVLEYERRFGKSLDRILFRELIEEGLIKEEESYLRLTDIGMSYSDSIGQLFISPEVRKQMVEYVYP